MWPSEGQDSKDRLTGAGSRPPLRQRLHRVEERAGPSRHREATALYAVSGFPNRYNLPAGTRLRLKPDPTAGLFQKGIVANGTDLFRGVQVALGDHLAKRHLIWTLTTTLALDPLAQVTAWCPGSSAPRHCDCSPLRTGQPSRISPLVTPSSYKGLQNPDLLPLTDRYYRGSDASAEERIKLCKQMECGLGRPGARWPGTGLAMARFEWSGYPWQ